jgi:hypothetical protein
VHGLGGISIAGDRAGRYGLVDPREIVGREVNVECPECFRQPVAPAGSHQGDDVLSLGQHPGNGKLRYSDPLLGRDGGQGI